MPLIACADCGRSISDAAPACIHCGRPREQDRDAVGGSAFAKGAGAPPSAEDGHARNAGTQQPAGVAEKSSAWKERLAAFAGFAVMFALFRLPVDSLALKMVAGGVLGFLLGLIPHTQARKRHAGGLGVAALVSCSVGGAAAGLLLSLPLCVGFTLYARRQSVTAEATG